MHAARFLFCGLLSGSLLLSEHVPDAWAVTVQTHFLGGAAPSNAVGGGNLVDIFSAAARRWEAAYGDSFTIDLYFGWAPVGDAGTHTLVEQGGEPNREIVGTICFDNTGAVSFFLDPTPDSNEEYRRRTEEFQDLGAGYVNVARIFGKPFGDAMGRCDLLSVALHEIGHALGMSGANTSFRKRAGGGFIVVDDDLPFAGSVIPLSSNRSGVTSHVDPEQVVYGTLMAGVGGDERRIPSGLDILINAQLSRFRFLNLTGLSESGPPPVHRLARGIPGEAPSRDSN